MLDVLKSAWLRARLTRARRSAVTSRLERSDALAAEASARLRRDDADLASWTDTVARSTREWHAAENEAHAAELALAAIEAIRLERRTRRLAPAKSIRAVGAPARWVARSEPAFGPQPRVVGES